MAVCASAKSSAKESRDQGRRTTELPAAVSVGTVFPYEHCTIMSNRKIAMGIAVGIAIGAGMGTAMDNIGMGVGVGLALGIALGSAWKAWDGRE